MNNLKKILQKLNRVECVNVIKICFDILRLHKQQIQQNQNTYSSLPSIVVVGLLIDYLTRYYHHKKSLTTNRDEQIGSTLETSSSSPSSLSSTVTTSTSSFLNTGGRTTRERLFFSEAT
ncbi:unnamed protein product [Rotaria sordida]|uniref:Uncharacterized protein n=1 Tax=Rotaria sordida TaxID=392033 RepID=A0A819LLP1_9BILA|nr:unnamed protein product [Rotaria sordida]